jgi:hypothetical protein
VTLAELVAQRLERAGITWDDPGLVQLRAWNAAALERGRLAVEVRRGQFGATRPYSNTPAETAKP